MSMRLSGVTWEGRALAESEGSLVSGLGRGMGREVQRGPGPCPHSAPKSGLGCKERALTPLRVSTDYLSDPGRQGTRNQKSQGLSSPPPLPPPPLLLPAELNSKPTLAPHGTGGRSLSQPLTRAGRGIGKALLSCKLAPPTPAGLTADVSSGRSLGGGQAAGGDLGTI